PNLFIFIRSYDLGRRGGQLTLDRKCAKQPVDGAARSNALHNLLPEITSLGKIQRADLPGFLRYIAFANVDAELRNAARDPEQIQRRRTRSPRTSLVQRLRKLLCQPKSHPELPGFPRFLARAQHGNSFRLRALLPDSVSPLKMRKLGHGNSSAFKSRARLGSSEPECSKFVTDVRDLNIVGNDIAIEELQYFVALAEFRIHQQRVASLENIKIGLDLPLRIEHESVNAATGSKIAHVIRHHAIHPANAIAACNRNLRPPAQVIEP